MDWKFVVLVAYGLLTRLDNGPPPLENDPVLLIERDLDGIIIITHYAACC